MSKRGTKLTRDFDPPGSLEVALVCDQNYRNRSDEFGRLAFVGGQIGGPARLLLRVADLSNQQLGILEGFPAGELRKCSAIRGARFVCKISLN